MGEDGKMSRKTSEKKKQVMIKNDKQKKTPREKSRNEVIAWETVGLTLFVLSWVCIILPAVLSDSEGHLSYGWVFLLLFFILSISSVVVLIRIFPDAAALDMEKGVAKYLNRDFTKIADAGKQTMEERLKKHGFRETKEGFYRKKKFSFTKDAVCFYVALTDAEYPGKTCDNITSRMERIPEKTKAVCEIVFLYRTELTQRDRDWLKNETVADIAMETVLPTAEGRSVIPVLVDSTTGVGEYLSKTGGISIYAHGCRLLKKLCRK